jgi:hypothetical protein
MDKGTNYLLTKIVDIISQKEVAPIFGSSSSTGTFAAGASKISIINSGGANATITSAGTSYTLTPNETITLDPGFAKRNNVVTYNATGTTIKFIIYR